MIFVVRWGGKTAGMLSAFQGFTAPHSGKREGRRDTLNSVRMERWELWTFIQGSCLAEYNERSRVKQYIYGVFIRPGKWH